jgi:hypothetical protein
MGSNEHAARLVNQALVESMRGVERIPYYGEKMRPIMSALSALSALTIQQATQLDQLKGGNHGA